MNGRTALLDRARHRAVRRQAPQQPYAAALLKHVSTKGLSLEQVFKRVRVNVMQVTEAKQNS